MTKVKEKKSRSGTQETRIKKLQREQEKQQLLKAAKTEELLQKRAEKKSSKQQNDSSSEFNVFDRFKKKAKK